MRKVVKIFTYILHSYFVTFFTLLCSPSTAQFERDNLKNVAIYYSFYTFLPLIFHLYCCNIILQDKSQWSKRIAFTIPFSIIYFGFIFLITEENFNIISYILIALFSAFFAFIYKFLEEEYFTFDEKDSK
jgi:hypothetical protein